MAGTSHARIKRVHSAQHFQWLFRIGNGIPQQRVLIWPGNTFLISRAGIPCGRNNGLVVGERSVVNDDPMGKRTARRFMQAQSDNLVLRELRRVEGCIVAFQNVFTE